MNTILKEELMRHAPDVLQSPKVAAIVASTTIATGTGTIFEWIPSNIGSIVSVLGGILTTILIVSHIIRIFRDSRHGKLKFEKLELEIAQLKTLEGSKDQ